jgi:hypothetical protein
MKCAGKIRFDSFCRDSDEADTERLQRPLALFVRGRLPGMDAAVYLESQRFFNTVEIHDERPNRVLSAELEPLKATAPQRLPENRL